LRIRNRLLVLTFLVMSLYALGLLVVFSYMVNTKFYDIESSLALNDVQRVVNAIKFDADGLSSTVKDYAAWDDTWEFLRGANPRFVDENVAPGIFENLNIFLFILYDANGRKVYSACFEPLTGLVSSPLVPERLDESPALRGVVNNLSGFIPWDDGILLAAAYPVTRSDFSGRPAGSLVMAKKINPVFVQDIRERTGVFLEKVEGPIPKDVVTHTVRHNLETGLLQDPRGDDLFGFIGYTTENGNPLLVLRTRTIRPLYTQSIDFALIVMVLFGMISLLYLFSLLMAFRSWIAEPLSSIEKELVRFDLNGRPGPAEERQAVDEDEELPVLAYSKEDELGHIAETIKEMHQRIRESHEQIRLAKENLEAQMCKQTADLASVNIKLEVFRKILENTSEAVIITDLDGCILDMNDAMVVMTGYSRVELIGANSRLFKSERHDKSFYTVMWDAILHEGHWEGELWDRRKDGMLFPKWQTINTIYDENGEPVNYVGVSTDISVIKEAEEKLNHLAYYDPLTGLPNRMLFSDRLAHQVVCSKRGNSCFALLFIDLDRFKNVNDTMGHVVGDALLVKVAERLKDSVRDSDTLCRIGGDEFTLILSDLSEEENAGMIASTIVQNLARSFEIESSLLYIGASIGIALFPKDGSDSETLLRKADAAMYLAKDAGKGVYRYASGEMELANRGRLEIESKMHRALEQNEFILYYQPQNMIADATPNLPFGLVGVEALIRWSPEPDVLIPPGDFLPVAEETGFIAPLGDWVMYQACRDAKKWFDMGKPVQVSVNVAARQFDSGNLADRVASVLATTGLPPDLLKLEVTESSCMRNISHVTEVMRRIRAMGVSFAIDDFGTGYCSLQYLHRLPVDVLKIDQSFVRSMDDSHAGGDIVSAVISMAKAFGLSSIAEGVETYDQLEKLKSRGCDYIQGFLVSRPLPFADFVAYLNRL